MRRGALALQWEKFSGQGRDGGLFSHVKGSDPSSNWLAGRTWIRQTALWNNPLSWNIEEGLMEII
jgi:hypothetical protein